MEHPTHTQPESSLWPKTAVGAGAFLLVTGVLAAFYINSQPANSLDVVNSYDNCKAGILAHLVRPDKATFLNKPAGTEITPAGKAYSLLMKVRASNGFGTMMTVTYRCTITKLNGDFYGVPTLEVVSHQ